MSQPHSDHPPTSTPGSTQPPADPPPGGPPQAAPPSTAPAGRRGGAPQAHPDQPIRVALVGAGFFGVALADACRAHPAFRVDAVTDPDQDSAVALAARLGAAAVDADDLLRDPDVDLVMVASPNHTHAAIAVRALDAGRHVYVEKPLAVDETGVRHVLAAADRNDGLLLVGHIERCLPGVKRLHRLVVEGTLGALSEGSASRTRLVHPQPGRDDWWKLDTARTGGELLHEIHELDLLVWLFGHPDRVTCTAGGAQEPHQPGPDRARRGSPQRTVHRTVLGFASGAVATHDLSTSAHQHEWNLRVGGALGAVEIDFRAACATHWVDGQAVDTWPVLDDPEANASLREAAHQPQRYNAPGAASPLWMAKALHHELDDVAAAVHGETSVLLDAPGAAVLTGIAAAADADHDAARRRLPSASAPPAAAAPDPARLAAEAESDR